jgi:hypothetical protein
MEKHFETNKVSNAAKPIFKNLNLSIIPANKKNIDLSPIMANIFEKNTI